VSDPRDTFQLRPVRAAKVSEISETTAASPVPPEERVNFHIGNPVQDERLVAAFAGAALDFPGPLTSVQGPDIELLAASQEWSPEETEDVLFLIRLIRVSAPYMPRGGYQRGKAGELVSAFAAWLQRDQAEPLAYDLGDTTGRREVLMASGGLMETLRVFLHALSTYLIHLPARVFTWGVTLPPHILAMQGINFGALPPDRDEAIRQLTNHLAGPSVEPTFLILGTIPSEETRRLLRHLALRFPLCIIEMNEAPNHLSLAREAGLARRVLRCLTAGALDQRFRSLSPVFLAGSHEFLTIFEVAHFQLKGTPSASEAELLAYLLRKPPSPQATENPAHDIPLQDESLTVLPDWRNPFAPHSQRLLGHLATRAGTLVDRAGATVESILIRHDPSNLPVSPRWLQTRTGFDVFEGKEFRDLLAEIRSSCHDPEWQWNLAESFLAAFVNKHPEYDARCCRVVSGSSRTALGLLGFHCGIREVIIPDLSWTYEHCFPVVTAVPITTDLTLDVDAIIDVVRQRIATSPDWIRNGAVALNNPHNATGRAFAEEDVRRLLQWLLTHHVTVIDDLAYQGVEPRPRLGTHPTLRQLAQGLARQGNITDEEAAHVITVHSVSKTDCLAGSRLAVVEIRDDDLRRRFTDVNRTIRPNIGAILLSYLFYRSGPQRVTDFWITRNTIFDERMCALENAVHSLPADRNPFGINIHRPTGSMYPLMVIESLPAGLSLDWLSSGLARQGIGLLPLSAFARTEQGFDTGRKTFRLTLGGVDGADRLAGKTRRVLIDLNRMIAEQEARFVRRTLPSLPSRHTTRTHLQAWNELEDALRSACENNPGRPGPNVVRRLGNNADATRFLEVFVSERLEVFHNKYLDHLGTSEELLGLASRRNGDDLLQLLEQELYKDSSADRARRFRRRSYDRTVHPTQMYSLHAEQTWEKVIEHLVSGEMAPPDLIRRLADALAAEYVGTSVAITSVDEGSELLLDLESQLRVERHFSLRNPEEHRTFLSYWGDWDGSNRPSGQGHRLVAAVLLSNVTQLAHLLEHLTTRDPSIRLTPELRRDLGRLEADKIRFRRILDTITVLTHQLERRYRGVLPFYVQPGRLRRFGMRVRLASDPLTALWEHNDRLERRMLQLREERRSGLQYYFALNKKLRKTLHGLLPAFRPHLEDRQFALEAARYRDLLKRFVITPRIHQNMITAQDPFAIDTTVHNLMEINDIAGSCGNPGMILALQVSMSTEPEALIAVDRKLRAKRDDLLRNRPDADLPPVGLIPLFEDVDAVRGITAYLDRLWEYAIQSRSQHQPVEGRFREILAEVFIAGSDLSQHVGQAPGESLYRQARYQVVTWLAERRLVDEVRVKLGSGEPMQRQGGSYAPASGLPAFLQTQGARARLVAHLQPSARKSSEYATTPLSGILAGGELRTFQSNLSERLRHLPVTELADILHHVRLSQRFYERELARAAEPLVDTRLQFGVRGKQELQRLTAAGSDPVLEDFLTLVTQNFRHIVYGTEDDVVGIHIISYFIARTTPPLRDRPTFRPGKGVAGSRGQQILQRIAETIPLARYGSLLRAIAHNQAQTAVLGVNQLTTGVFRALAAFSQKQFVEGSGADLIPDRILPSLPVHEMLHTLRLFQDADLTFLNRLERSFPAGNSAFTALREDLDAMQVYLGELRRETVRRHGLNVAEFFDGPNFQPELLPALRPDLAVLLQPDLFNTDIERLLPAIRGPVEGSWASAVHKLLLVPAEVREWRKRAWDLLEEPVSTRVASFVELAMALSTLRADSTFRQPPESVRRRLRPPRDVLASSTDDTMRGFLTAAMDYLSELSQQSLEVPTTVIRALHEVRRILKIEEQALPPHLQDRLRFFLLQIARLTGENG
jgi:aspartate/methionine/tyrosine aminotransferase